MSKSAKTGRNFAISQLIFPVLRELAIAPAECILSRRAGCAIAGEPAARHDHVHVRMVGHRRAPGVQYRSDADAGPEMLGVGRDGEHCLCRGREQEIVDHCLVVVGDVASVDTQARAATPSAPCTSCLGAQTKSGPVPRWCAHRRERAAPPTWLCPESTFRVPATHPRARNRERYTCANGASTFGRRSSRSKSWESWAREA